MEPRQLRSFPAVAEERRFAPRAQRLRSEPAPLPGELTPESWTLIQLLGVIRGGVSVIKDWKRRYDEGGLDAPNPTPRGRPKKMTTPEPLDPVPAQNEETRTVEQLRKENEYLRAEVAYLKKLKALLQAKEQPAQKKRG